MGAQQKMAMQATVQRRTVVTAGIAVRAVRAVTAVRGVPRARVRKGTMPA